MAEPSLYTYSSPLEGWSRPKPLSEDIESEGANAKSYINEATGTRSEAYASFISPITNGTRGGFDVHVYFMQTDAEQVQFAKELHERVRREFPELRIYKLFDRPLGPHPIGMFEINLHTPEQFGAFIPWLVINRGPLSALIHPNTDDEVRDHTQRATWMGQPIPLNVGLLKKLLAQRNA